MSLADTLQVQVLRAMGARSRQVPTPAGKVHVVELAGSGSLPRLLLLHGLTASAADFTPLMLRLRRQVQGIVAVDMPGHGLSEVPTGGLDARSLHAGMLAALEQVVTEPVVALGTSLGGVAAVRFAAARPDLARALVLLSPAGAPLDDAALRLLLGNFDLPDLASARRFIDLAFRASHPLRPVMAWGVRDRAGRPHVRSLLASLHSADLLELAELQALDLPVLLSWGQQEVVLPRHHLAFWRAGLPAGSIVEEPAGHGHAAFVTHPREVAEQILRFLAGLDQGRAAA